jgi:RNA polymerase sigma factor (sigma-70 family)
VELNKNFSDKALEDFELVQRAIHENDQSAYKTLMNRYHDTVYHTMLKMVRNRDDADDLTMEAFAKAFTKLSSYTPIYAFSTWLFRIASNNAIDFIRRQRQLLSIDEHMQADGEKDFSSNLQSNALDPEERFIRDQRQLIMRHTLFKLNDKYRQMIELRYFEELSYQEISERIGSPVGTVKAQLYRAKELLLGILKNDETQF